jgi:putative ABC transport system ATP-binding protein
MDNNRGDILIQAQDLRKSFEVGSGTVEVLKGVNLTIKKGQFVIIFGPSGCGKSTLLHTLLGLEAPTAGKVLVEGKDFYGMTEDERGVYRRHNVGMIYQQALWVSSFNVFDNVAFPMHLVDAEDAKIQQRVTESLTKVGMQDWANYTPTELSSGQQQKISLARSIMIDPAVIVADEPTGNLDTVSGQELIQMFVDLVDQGKTIIMITHDLEYLKYATNIFHVVDGLVVEEYSPKKKYKVQATATKKEINGGGPKIESNVRDTDFLKKLNL